MPETFSLPRRLSQNSIPFIRRYLGESLSKQVSQYKCCWCFCLNEYMRFLKAVYKSVCSWVKNITFKSMYPCPCKVSCLQRTVHTDGISSEFWAFLAFFFPLLSLSKSSVLWGHNGVNNVNKLAQKTQTQSGVQIWVCLVCTEFF